MLNEKKFKTALKKCGIKKNDNVYITTSLFSLGKTNFRNKNQYYNFFYKCLRDIIGKKSTIIFDAFSTNVVRDNRVHRGKSNKCTTGGFAKYFISLKDTVISDHPAHAIAANGRLAKYLCKNTSKCNYGLDSGLHNILKIKSKILRIGIDFTISSVAHVAESMVGVPYFYQKLIKIKVKKKGKIKSSYYTMFVRYLNLVIIYDNEKIKKDIIKKCSGKKTKLNKGFIYSVDTKKYFEFIKNKLKQNPHYLLKKIPNYTYGKIPFDGPSRGRDSVEQ